MTWVFSHEGGWIYCKRCTLRFKLMSCFDFKVPTLHRKIIFSLKKKSLSAKLVHTPFVCSIFLENVWYVASFCQSALGDVTQSACSSLSSHVTLQTSTMSYHAGSPEEPNVLVHNISSNIQRLTLLSKSHTALCHSHTYKCTQHANFHTTALTKKNCFVFANTHLSPWVVIRCVFVVYIPLCWILVERVFKITSVSCQAVSISVCLAKHLKCS